MQGDRFVVVARAEAKIHRRVLSQIHPAHRIDAELFCRFFEPDRRAVRLVHRLALFVLDKAMTQQCAKRFLVFRVVGFVVTHHG